MPNEIYARLKTGLTVYALVFDRAGQVWTGSAFAAPTDGNILSGTIALTEAQATGVYRGDMPGVAAGTYAIQVYEQLGGSPDANNDVLRGAGEMHWNGTAEVGRDVLATAAAVAALPSAPQVRAEIDANSTLAEEVDRMHRLTFDLISRTNTEAVFRGPGGVGTETLVLTTDPTLRQVASAGQNGGG